MINNYFNIRVPYYGAYVKYNWKKGDWGIGLKKDRIDELAKSDKTIIVSYGKSKQEYTIKAKKVQSYPIETIKSYNTKVYIIPKSILNYRKMENVPDLSNPEVFSKLVL